MDPSTISRELRLGRDADLTQRRWIVGLSLFGAAIGGVVGAYQTGILRTLPDPPVGPFDSARVDASDYGYKRFETPDGLLMTATFAMTAILAAAGGRNRPARHPLLPILTAGKTIYDAFTAVKLAREEWAGNKALCAYCQAATLTSFAAVALALPEAGRALRQVAGRIRQRDQLS